MTLLWRQSSVQHYSLDLVDWRLKMLMMRGWTRPTVLFLNITKRAHHETSSPFPPCASSKFIAIRMGRWFMFFFLSFWPLLLWHPDRKILWVSFGACHNRHDPITYLWFQFSFALLVTYSSWWHGTLPYWSTKEAWSRHVSTIECPSHSSERIAKGMQKVPRRCIRFEAPW